MKSHPYGEEITLRGHIIDSWVLPRVFDTIMDLGGEFEVSEIQVGRHKDETSFARMHVFAVQENQLQNIIAALQKYGAELVSEGDVQTRPAPRDGALPDDFYSSTNLPTQVRLNGRWTDVEGTEMDLVIVVEREAGRASLRPMAQVHAGDAIAVGRAGIRVIPLARARTSDAFSFMMSAVSSEKPKKLAIADIAREMQAVRDQGGKILFVAGPAIVHSGAAPHLAALIREGFLHVLFGGNAIAVHDIEAALFGTSPGINLASGMPVEGGHRNHMQAINAVRRAGSIRALVETGELRSGIMYEALRAGIEVVLAGSIRDDGPLPEVLTDTAVAQQRMREGVQGVGLAIMISTMLHSIATGNLLPAEVKTVIVDINPAVVTKLADRGTFQAVGLVTDAELFLRELVKVLGIRV